MGLHSLKQFKTLTEEIDSEVYSKKNFSLVLKAE